MDMVAAVTIENFERQFLVLAIVRTHPQQNAAFGQLFVQSLGVVRANGFGKRRSSDRTRAACHGRNGDGSE